VLDGKRTYMREAIVLLFPLKAPAIAQAQFMVREEKDSTDSRKRSTVRVHEDIKDFDV